MKKTAVIEHFGSQKNFARAINYTRQGIAQLPEDLPWHVQCMVEILTDGALAAQSPPPHAPTPEQLPEVEWWEVDPVVLPQ